MGSVKSLPTMLQKSVPTMFQKCCNQGVERASRVLLRYLAVILTAVTDGALAFDNPAPSAPLSTRTASLSPAKASYPLKVSANNRYLVDQDNAPFLMIGDAPQTLIANLSQAEAGA